tara:strand:- start:23235 stop:23450 length:216 start_codon:yes stop_codon:yes gene_type:complete
MNKLGPYIQKLMTTILDKDADEFVHDLAYNELNRLNIDIEEFLRKHTKGDVPEEDKQQTKKQLLQEEENNV